MPVKGVYYNPGRGRKLAHRVLQYLKGFAPDDTVRADAEELCEWFECHEEHPVALYTGWRRCASCGLVGNAIRCPRGHWTHRITNEQAKRAFTAPEARPVVVE